MKPAVRSVVETGIILAGIASFWPYTMGHRGVWYEAGLVAVLAALAALAVVRWRRFRRALSDIDAFKRED